MPVPKMVITAGLAIMNMALTASRKIEGPRLDDTSFTGGDPGGPRQRIWGTVRMSKDAIWGDELRGVEREQKTKGGKYNDVSYYASWAVEITCHPISAVTRVWFDTHLVLDFTGAGPVAPFDFATESPGQKGKGGGSSGGINLSDYVTIYLGTEDQEPDQRIEAEVDARIGIEGATPAYRGTAYIAFKEVPVQKFGNRVPQVTVEATVDATPQNIVENFTGDLATTANFMFSHDYSRILWAADDQVEVWDVPSRAQLVQIGLPFEVNESNSGGASYADGSWLGFKYAHDLYSFSADGTASNFIATMSPLQFVRVRMDGNGQEHFVAFNPTATVFNADGEDGDTSLSTPAAFAINEVFSDGSSIWAVGRVGGATETTVHFLRLVGVDATGPAYFSVGGLIEINTDAGSCAALAHDGVFVLQWGSAFYRIDPATQSVLTTRTDLLVSGSSAAGSFANFRFGADSIFLHLGGELAVEMALDDLTSLRTVSSLASPIYEPVNHAIWSRGAGGAIRVTHLDRVSGNTVTLGTVVADVCALAGLDPGDYDTSLLTQEIAGYGVALGSGKDWLAPLLDLYDVDARPHGFQLQFVPRGGASLGTIDVDSFARPDGDDEPFYRFPNGGATDVPREVVLKFKDVVGDQQPNLAHSGPITSADGAAEMTLDMSNLVLDASEARQLVARYHRRLSFDARSPSIELPASRIALEPADRYALGLASGDVSARLLLMEVGADGRISCEWARDDSSVALLDGADGQGLDAHVPAAIVIPAPSKGFLLDIPLLQDSDESASPQIYTSAAPYGDGAWPGVTFFQAVDGEHIESFDSAGSGEAASWGYANGVLADANPWLWDRGNSVNVTLLHGALSGATEAALDADPRLNQCLLGSEVLQFSGAVLEGDGSWTLSGFKRGRRGTEWACGSHAARDVFLLLDQADAVAAELSEVGTDLSFETVTLGRTGGFVTELGFTGASKKPYAPCHLDAVKEANGDWTLGWRRRTRVGGYWTGGTTIPLGEVSEAYKLVIMDGATEVRVIDVTSESATYTAAQQTADFGAEVAEGALEYAVYQISDAVGRGFAATATA